jgi:hypothetical protein
VHKLVTLLLLAALSLPARATAPTDGIAWLRDERAAFDTARREQRLVILYLEAVWCHWCHVMDQRTYADPEIRKVLAEHYVTLRIDQDLRPDLSRRYERYGWPATIVFAADGSEIVKRRGFIAPENMLRLLNAIVADPSPEAYAKPEAQATTPVSGLLESVRTALTRAHLELFDAELGGIRHGQKFLERDSTEYDLTLAAAGDATARARAVKSLDASLALLDPAWGGFYQYSTHGDWQHPHFEKLGALQAEYLRAYALAYAILGEQRYLDTAQAVRRYADTFLLDPAGAFYVSQDADLRPGEHSAEYFALDDRARRALGVPRVDRHRYTRETAALAEAYVALYEVSGERSALTTALRALEWIEAQRARQQGGYRHDEVDQAGPFLGDNLAAGRAQLALYRATGQRAWLTRAERTATFIAANFRTAAGYASAVRGASPIAPVAQIDENIALARWANLLSHYTGQATQRAIAEHAFGFLAQRDVALSRLTEAGILILDREMNADPMHLTVIGPKQDSTTQALYNAALRVAGAYKRLDWWDRSEGPLPNPDVNYPPLKKPAAFVCTDQRCSVPITRPEDIAAFLAERD